MKIVYGVQWLESEFGQRMEGWCLYVDKDACIRRTQEGSKNGPYEGGYYGPERPLRMYEIPFDSLDKSLQQDLTDKGTAHTSRNWQPKFKDQGTPVPS